MQQKIIIDTNIYIDIFNSGHHQNLRNPFQYIVFLAHPVLLNIKDDDVLEKLIIHLREMGLKGIEAYYPEQPHDLTARYIKIADRHGLLITGGTDFHGSIKPEIKMGSGRGNFFVPYELYEKLISCL